MGIYGNSMSCFEIIKGNEVRKEFKGLNLWEGFAGEEFEREREIERSK